MSEVRHMNTECVACNEYGDVHVFFNIHKRMGAESNCVGFGTGNVCFNCIKKYMMRDVRALIITGLAMILLCTSLFVVFLVLSDEADIAPMIIFVGILDAIGLGLFIGGMLTRKKIIKQCNDKITTDKTIVAAKNVALKHFQKAQYVPAENIGLNFESLLENNLLDQMQFVFKTAKTDDEKAKIVATFLSKCTNGPIDGSKARFFITNAFPLTDAYGNDLSHLLGLLPLAYKVWRNQINS